MKKLTIILTALSLIFTMSISAQDLNDAGKAYNKGIGFAKENKTMEAIQSYQKCANIAGELGDVGEGLKVKAETQITSLYMKLGIDAYKAKTWDTAISLFVLSSDYAITAGKSESVVKANNYIATSYAARGNGLYKEKKYDDALASFEKALEYNPEYFKAYYGKAICYNKTANTEGLEEAVNKVIELGGEDKTVEKSTTMAAKYFLKLSNKALQVENYGEAAMMAKKCIEYNYLETTAYYIQVVAHNNLENWDEAIKNAEYGLKTEKDDKSNLYFELGRAYEGKGDATKACESYKNVSSGPNVDAANYQRNTVLNCN
ncbi:MAG: tetratricopeptide repeat protein [Bacteroidota bacterium]